MTEPNGSRNGSPDYVPHGADDDHSPTRRRRSRARSRSRKRSRSRSPSDLPPLKRRLADMLPNLDEIRRNYFNEDEIEALMKRICDAIWDAMTQRRTFVTFAHPYFPTVVTDALERQNYEVHWIGTAQESIDNMTTIRISWINTLESYDFKKRCFVDD